MFVELDCVTLTKPLPEGGVPIGSSGVILIVYEEPTPGCEVEFFDSCQRSLGIFTIDESYIKRQV